jgi:hypothetical protein
MEKQKINLQLSVSRNTKVGVDVIASRLQCKQVQVVEFLLNSNYSIKTLNEVLDSMPSLDGSIDESYLISKGIIIF